MKDTEKEQENVSELFPKGMGMYIKIKDGSTWPDPTNKETRDAMWRLVHIENPTKADMLRVVALAEAYDYLITSKEMSLKKATDKISCIRKMIAASR